MSKLHLCKILEKSELISGIVKFSIESQEIAAEAVPGQFLEIRCSDGIETILRRPISISNIDTQKSTVEFIVQVRGKATNLLAKKNPGEMLDIIGPIGNGFSVKPVNNPIIIGGGIGVFPLYFLAKSIISYKPKIFLGFRNKDLVVLENEFKSLGCNFEVATDDGSYGYNGFAIELLSDEMQKSKVDMIYACGPLPMLKKIKELSSENDIPCEISVEERMGCGVGACLGCAIKIMDQGGDWRYGHVCKDGPVFDANKIII